MSALRKFSSQMEPELFDEAQELAGRQGRQFQSLLGEAVKEYLDRHRQRPRRNVLEAYGASVKEHEALYRALSK